MLGTVIWNNRRVTLHLKLLPWSERVNTDVRLTVRVRGDSGVILLSLIGVNWSGKMVHPAAPTV